MAAAAILNQVFSTCICLFCACFIKMLSSGDILLTNTQLNTCTHAHTIKHCPPSAFMHDNGCLVLFPHIKQFYQKIIFVFSCSCLDFYFLHLIMILPFLTCWQFAKTTWCFCLTARLKVSSHLSACLRLCVYVIVRDFVRGGCEDAGRSEAIEAAKPRAALKTQWALLYTCFHPHINTNKLVHNKTTHTCFFSPHPQEREDCFKALLWPSVNQDKNKWPK